MKNLLILIITVMIVNPINAQFTNNHLADKVLGQDDFFSSDLGVGENKFEEPIGIAIDFTNGKMYVADSENNRVLRFSYPITSSNQAAELVFGQPDFYANGDTIVARNRMDDPKGIAVDHTGRLWVVDNQNHRVIWFNDAYAITTNQPDADGVLGQTTFETEYFTTSQSGMDHPKGIAISPTGTLFVSDEDNDRILRFDNAANKANGANADGVLGQLDFASNGSGTTQASFDDPYGICLDNAGRLWVADRSNNRVLRFDNAANKANGANADGVLGQADFVSNDDSTSQARMDNPENVAVDNQGRLYVVDIGNQRILIFNDAANQPNGVDAHGVFGQPDFISDNEGSSQTDLHLDQLSFIVYDSINHHFWLTDTDNHRLLRFSEGTALEFSSFTLDEDLFGLDDDGSFKDSIIIRIAGDTFTGFVGEDFINSEKVQIGNVPEGLTAQVMRLNDDSLVLKLLGNAIIHHSDYSISNLILTLNPTALHSGNTHGITLNGSSFNVDFYEYERGAGNALSLDGDVDYLHTDYSGVGGSNPRTIEAWIKTTKSDASIISYGRPSNGQVFTFRVQSRDGVAGAIRVEVGGGYIVGSTPVNDGKWHHIACVLDTAIGTNIQDVLLYVDGKLEVISSSGYRNINTVLALDVRIGKTISSNNEFLGEIDEIRFWNVAKLQDEIRQNMHLVAQGTEEHLVMYYNFNSNYFEAIDKANKERTSFREDATRVISNAPIGEGISTLANISMAGTYTFPATHEDTDLDITFMNTPNDEIVVFYIEGLPRDTIPENHLPAGYWIVENFGVNTGLDMTFKFNFPDGAITSTLLTDYILNRRGTHEYGAWNELDSNTSEVGALASENYIQFSGIDAFSMFVPSSESSPLPVKLLSFNAVLIESEVLLTWQTAAEMNTFGFEIERSTDGVNWENFGFIFGNGYSLEILDYEFIDVAPVEGVNYYRLKILDDNGDFTYSSIEQVFYEILDDRFRIYPNFTQDQFTVENGEGQASIFNSAGQLIRSFRIDDQKIEINISDLASGQYFLHVQDDMRWVSEPFIKL